MVNYNFSFSLMNQIEQYDQFFWINLQRAAALEREVGVKEQG